MTNVEAANREAPSVQKTEGGSSSREESVSTSNTNESNKETSVREAAANTNADSEKASNGGGRPPTKSPARKLPMPKDPALGQRHSGGSPLGQLLRTARLGPARRSPGSCRCSSRSSLPRSRQWVN